MGHVTVSPSVGDAFQTPSSISTAAGELEAVLNQVHPVNITAVPQGPVTRNVPAQDPTSDLQGSANTAALAAQQLSATSTDDNQFQAITQIHAEDMALQSANSAKPVPGLPEMSADDVEAVTDSGVAPSPSLDSVRIDFTVGQQLSFLQLGKESDSGSTPGTEQFAVGSGLGPGPGTGGVTPPVIDQLGQPSTDPVHPGAITHTGTTADATHTANSVQTGYESTATAFHGNQELPKALIPGALPPGPEYEAEMPEGGNRPEPAAMDSSDTQTDIQHPSTSTNQQPVNLGAPGQPSPVIRFDSKTIANVVRAASSGQFWDTLGPLKGATAAHMQQLQEVLQKIAGSQQPAETDPDKDESEPEKVVVRVHRTSESASTSLDSSPDSSSSSDSETASDTDSQAGTAQKKKKKEKKKKKASVRGVKDLFEQVQDDVLVVSDESADECGSVREDESCPTWATQLKDEPAWIVRYPNTNPYVHSKPESTEDGWYRGEDCASPSEVAYPGKNAILPAADGSLALKADAVLPGAPLGRSKYGDRILERRVFHKKAKRKGHEELDPIPQATLDERARENREALAPDNFWGEEIDRALYLPTEADTP